MANQGEMKAYWAQKSVAGSHHFNDAYWLFSWTQSSIGLGNSEIKWTLKAMQDDYSGTDKLASRCDIYINNELIFDCPDAYYRFFSGGTVVKSGAFQYQHDVNGKASFEVRLEGRIYVLNSNELTQTFELDDNYPYTHCKLPTITNLSPLFPKPGGSFEFSWSNAAAGTANPIRAYKLSYALIDSNGNSQHTAEQEIISSLTYGSWNQTLPSEDKYRGCTIQISIQVLGTIENYNSEEKREKLGVVNTKPVLVVDSSRDIIPSTGNTTINFSLGATDNDGQELSFYYSTGSAEKIACSSNPRFTINEKKTFTFYAYDGVEYSNGVSKTIQKNFKPTCEIKIEGNKYKDQNIKCKVTGGYSNNKFKYYLKYGTSSYLLATTSSTEYYIGDIRALLGSKLNGLSPNGGYNCSFFVIREDGIEQTESNEARNNFNTPFLSFVDDLGTNINKSNPYFSQKINIIITGYGTNVNNIGLKDTDKVANVEGSVAQLDTREVDYSASFSTLRINNSFDLNLSFNLIKISKIDLQPIAGYKTPFGEEGFKFNAYTDNSLNFYFNIPADLKYGFNGEELVIKSGGYSSTANYNESSSGESGAREYTINGRKFYSAFLEKRTQLPASLDITYELKNKYGDIFSGSSTLNLIYSAPAKQVDNPYLQVEGTGLENWAYLKEGMPIYTGLEIYSVIKPTVSFLCQKGENWQILSSPTLVESEEKFSIEGYNTEVYKYTILEPIYTLGAINEDFSTAFKVKITTGSDTVEKKFLSHSGEELSCEVRGHYAPTIKIETASLSDGKLTTEFSVEDWGLTNNDEDKKIKLSLRDKDGNISEKELVTYASEIEWGLTDNENEKEFLYVAPILTTILTTYKLNDPLKQRYFETKKTNEPPSVFYFLVYNILPTIAYRQNCIGLNTNNPQYIPSSDEDNKKAILDIHSYGENKIIQLLHTSGGTTTTATINLEDFSLREFIIDCGSW